MHIVNVIISMKKIKINHFSQWLIALTLFFTPSVLLAKHIVGGEITYKFLSGDGLTKNRYEFTMRIYRDGNTQGGAPLDPIANIGIFNASTGRLIESFGQPISTITQVALPTYPCLVPPDVKVQEGLYIFVKELPVISETYLVMYQRCCRNITINNVIDPGKVGASYTVEITGVAQRTKNNSPIFKQFPPTVICAGEPLKFDHSATDVEGNQLVYEFCQPLGGGNEQQPLANGSNNCATPTPNPPCFVPYNNVIFASNYNYLRPMAGNPVIKIDRNTGLITGTPELLGQFVVGVCVSEYNSSGQLLTVLRRDFQFNVAECKPLVKANVLADSIAGNTYFIKSCGENNVQINNKSFEQVNVNNFSFNINIQGQIKTYNTWQPTITFPDTGIYRGNLLLNPGTQCSDTIYLVFTIAPSVKSDFSFTYDTCVAGPISFTDKSSSLIGVTKWKWTFNDGTTSTLKNPQHLYGTPGRKDITLTAENGRGCKNDLNQTINWQPVPPLLLIEPSTFNGCTPAKVFFNNLSKPIDSTYTIKWNFGDTTTSSAISPTHVYEKPGIYSVSIDVASPIGCKTSRSFSQWITIKQGTKADFDYSPKSITNFANSVTFTDKSTFATRWQWFFGEKGYSSQQNPTYKFRDTGMYRITLVTSNQFGCTDSISQLLDVIPKVTYFLPNAFTPNDDGTNDEFRGKGFVEGMANFKMDIINRWGERVFSTTNPMEGWNGQKNNKGEPSPQGVYLCLVTFTTPRGEDRQLRAYATLIR
jgi:gliding motility-associated-like protein